MGNVLNPEPDAEDSKAAAQEGRRINVEVNCSHDGKCVSFSQHQGQVVTSKWTASRLHAAIEVHTGVHRCCQRLMFRGRVMEDKTTIESVLGCDPWALPGRKIRLYLYVDRHQFPQKLGPFSTIPVNLAGEDFELPRIGEESRRCGFYWDLPPHGLERFALHPKNGRISGQVSPLHAITLDAASRQKAEIPSTAQDFVWSYPVEDYSSVESDAYYMDCWEERVCDGDVASVKSFLSVGGFMYFGPSRELAGVTTIGPYQEGVPGGLHFDDPRRWLPEWTMALAEQGRLQTITIKSLRDVGAELYAWLRPNELIEGPDGNPLPLGRQPVVPFGGFVYLFHRDLASVEPEVTALDRYFGVLEKPPDRTEDMDGPLTSRAFRAFTLADADDPCMANDGRPGLDGDTPDATDISGLIGTSFQMTTPRETPVQTPSGSPESSRGTAPFWHSPGGAPVPTSARSWRHRKS